MSVDDDDQAIPYFSITTEEITPDHDEYYYVGLINVGFSDWPMLREVWRSEYNAREEDAIRSAHDQFVDCMRTLFNSRQNGASV